MTSRLRISAIRFLNPAPLMWDFEHPPEQNRLAKRYEIHGAMPSQCAAELAAGNADIGLVPIAALATTPCLAVIPGCTIASLDRVRSILMVIRRGRLGSIRRLATDIASRTSNAYAQIILKKFYGIEPQIVPHQPNLDAMLRDCDAAVLIGDPALLALQGEAARLNRTGEDLEYLDLAHLWNQHTGVPWVSAVWAVRPNAVEAAGLDLAEVAEDFIHSRDDGMAHVDELVREWSPRISIPSEIVRAYLSGNIHYVLDDACLAGMDLFFRYAADYGVLPGAPPLRWLL